MCILVFTLSFLLNWADLNNLSAILRLYVCIYNLSKEFHPLTVSPPHTLVLQVCSVLQHPPAGLLQSGLGRWHLGVRPPRGGSLRFQSRGEPASTMPPSGSSIAERLGDQRGASPQ